MPLPPERHLPGRKHVASALATRICTTTPYIVAQMSPAVPQWRHPEPSIPIGVLACAAPLSEAEDRTLAAGKGALLAVHLLALRRGRAAVHSKGADGRRAGLCRSRSTIANLPEASEKISRRQSESSLSGHLKNYEWCIQLRGYGRGPFNL